MNQLPPRFVVYVVDDDPAVLESSIRLIRAYGYEAQGFRCAETFLDAIDPAVPGCLLLDLRMPGMDGLELLAHLHLEVGLDIPVIMVTAHAEISDCVYAMQHGAIDFLEKPYRPKRLLETLHRCQSRELERWRVRMEQIALRRKADSLTSDEWFVLRGIVNGKLLKQIAARMDVSLRTVQFRRASIMKKLEVDNRAELVQLGSQLLETEVQQTRLPIETPADWRESASHLG